MHVLPLFLLALPIAAGAEDAAARPNVLLLVADDLGYGDVGVYGCQDIPTPNIDAMAARGVRFTDGYVSAPVCSPCRAGLMTGRYQTRFGHELNPPGADKYEGGMPQTERTMADRLREAGYVTGHIGKWHLGNSHLAGFAPRDRGFSESIWYPGQKKLPPLTKWRDGRPEREEGYVNDAMARDAADFIARHKACPWFLYVPFLAVHEPLDVPEELLDRFAKLEPPKRRRMAALTWSMDQAIGTILGALDKAGLERRTLVVFLSDNGSYPKSTGSNGPLRGAKGNLFEGGIRVPMVIQWTGTLPAGKTYGGPVIALDVLPTALAAARVAVPPDWKLDGVDLLPYLKGENQAPPHETLYWRYGDQMAIRSGPWKLVRARETKTDTALTRALFDLGSDMGESEDLAAQNPEKLKELESRWQRWNAEQAKPLWGGKDEKESPQG